ncbi:hypothetical protein LUZ60_000421 [Juncus effusus]|nr:hypothetical protein LUZ60_000421 [Juncus effusus]
MLRKMISKDQIKSEIMAESLNSSSDSLTQKFFRVPGLFVRLSTKGLLDQDLAWSPTSPLDLKNFSNLGSFTLISPKGSNLDGKPKTWGSDKVCLGLIDALNEEISQFGGRKVLIGSELKKPNVELMSDCNNNGSNNKVEIFEAKLEDQIAKSLSMREIAQSEDYTCITTHGPNATKMHIFGDCILEMNNNNNNNGTNFSVENNNSIWSIEPIEVSQFGPCNVILDFCGHCNKKLHERKDIFMYLGEKAFCTPECRSQYMGEEIEENNMMMDESSNNNE